MNKIILGAALSALMLSAPAFASEVNLDINMGAPAIIAPAPVVIGSPVVIAEPVFVDRGPGYDPHHHDYTYWEHKKAHERWVQEHARHDDHRDHDRDHDRYDHR